MDLCESCAKFTESSDSDVIKGGCVKSEVIRALDCGKICAVRALLENECDVTYVTQRSSKLNGFDILDAGASALHAAIQVRHNFNAGCLHGDCDVTDEGIHDVISQLCAKGVDTNLQTAHGRTATHYAILYGDQSDVIELLAKHKGDFEICDQRQQTALLSAVSYEKQESIAVLIECSVEVNASIGGRTALHMIFDKETPSDVNYDVARLLLGAGADVNAVDGFGDAPLHIAVANENVEAVRFLLERKPYLLLPEVEKNTSLPAQSFVETFRAEYPEMTHLVRDENLSNAESRERYAPIHQAMFVSDVTVAKEMVVTFLDVRADLIDVETALGKTCLMLAVAQQKVEVAKFLISRGANVKARDKNGWTLLHIAAKKFEETKENFEFFAELMQQLGDVTARTMVARATVLHVTAESNKPELARLLLEAGASLQLENQDGERPLEVALVKKHLQVLTVLLQGGDSLDDLRLLYSDELTEMEHHLLEPEHVTSLHVVLSCGYRFNLAAILDQLDLDRQLRTTELVLTYTLRPLRLKRMSANVVRRALTPNAFAAVDRLPLPPGGRDTLKAYITIEL